MGGDMQRRGGAVRFRMPRRRALAAGPPLLSGAAAAAQGERGGKSSRRKKMAVARLGGGRGGFFGAVRRLRMRWVAAAYRRALRRLRAFYARALEDLIEGAAAVSSLHSHYAGADCSFGTAFAPAVTVGNRY
ncbi:uncharacterized protein LOC123402781 [Hordeum vulgare subsp. vulgare]|uniref:Uncharacterized protein n=1 Tax=Hordeum vulgare subsp. vulgare TaxID=112509 RepID=A0A8I7BCI7_HORVV|nr:uncharacterized protein LOC123402781 [Hordeum vulgare subsp. vulgare]